MKEMSKGVSITRKIKQIIEAAGEKKAESIKILSLSPLTWIADHFVICTGSTMVQTKAIAEAMIEKVDAKPRSVEGMKSGRWILLDYGDVIVHIFLPEAREFYRLERVWGDAEETVITESSA